MEEVSVLDFSQCRIKAPQPQKGMKSRTIGGIEKSKLRNGELLVLACQEVVNRSQMNIPNYGTPLRTVK
jgi:hypothetical protein